MIAVGAAVREMQVPRGTALAGYGRRRVRAEAPLRALQVAAVALAEHALLVTVDALAIDADFAAAVGERVAAQRPVAPERVVVAAVHTHSGPVGLGRRWRAGDGAPAARAAALEAAVEASLAAWDAERPARATVRRARVSGVAADRNTGTPPTDPVATLVEWSDPEGRPLAGLVHFACHPTVLGPDNGRPSADLAGEVRARWCERHGRRPLAWLTGAAATISTRFTRRDRTPEELGRLAGLVVDALDAAAPAPLELDDVVVRRVSHPLPPAADDHDAAAAELAAATAEDVPVDPVRRRLHEARVEGLRRRAARGPSAPVDAHLVTLDLGGLVIAGFPGEVFPDDAARLRGPRGALLLVAGLVGDDVGYLPPPGATGYERDAALVAPGAGPALVGAAAALLSGGGA